MYNNFMNGYPYLNYQQQPKTDIGQVNNEQEAVNAYVAAGCSKIMFTPDDKTVYVKCVAMNGQATLDIFDRRTASQTKTEPEYVTHSELTEAINAIKKAMEGNKKEEGNK